MQLDLLLQLVSGDVKYGYAISLPINKVSQLPHICMAPLNIQVQWTINELGEIVKKIALLMIKALLGKIQGQASILEAIHLASKNAKMLTKDYQLDHRS